MREIPLSQGQVAIVDDADYEWLSEYKWYATLRPYGNCYAFRTIYKNGRCRSRFMHREIMNVRRGQVIDHANGDGLDNRRCNLRIASQSQNIAHSRMHCNNTSGYRGVSWDAANRKWHSQVTIDGRRLHLGFFTDPKEAARAYDKATLEHFGKFARLNFPQEAASGV